MDLALYIRFEIHIPSHKIYLFCVGKHVRVAL
jgi:hypothetical protein